MKKSEEIRVREAVDRRLSSLESSSMRRERIRQRIMEEEEPILRRKMTVAEKALPYCNIVCLTGEDMQTALSGYLEVLFELNPASVGGKLPGEEFYYIHEKAE